MVFATVLMAIKEYQQAVFNHASQVILETVKDIV
jgi:hypothetical protein